MTLEHLDGETCALIVAGLDQEGVNKARVIPGVLHGDDGDLVFQVKDGRISFPLPEDWSRSIKDAPAEKKDLFLQCDHFFEVSRESFSKIAGVFELEPTLINWPPE